MVTPATEKTGCILKTLLMWFGESLNQLSIYSSLVC